MNSQKKKFINLVFVENFGSSLLWRLDCRSGDRCMAEGQTEGTGNGTGLPAGFCGEV